jgi:hypothetical protein
MPAWSESCLAGRSFRNCQRLGTQTGAMLLPLHWGIQNILCDHRIVFEPADQGDLVKIGEIECA